MPGETSSRYSIQKSSSSIPPSDDSLWVTAKTSDKLPHPYAENWIGEPLRVLLGQLVFPRLVARNFGNGTSTGLVTAFATSFISGNHRSFPGRTRPRRQTVLGVIREPAHTDCRGRDGQGQPGFEAHEISRFYEELIQATQGSRWVFCMTLASTAEAIARMLMSPDEQRSDFAEKDIEGLEGDVSAWKGDERLRVRGHGRHRACWPEELWKVSKRLGAAQCFRG